MQRVFNLGVGMVLVVPFEQADQAVARAGDHGHEARVIGRLVAGSGLVELRGTR
jgi:phosphoribosylformylglycinamidine cyclo-ligase